MGKLPLMAMCGGLAGVLASAASAQELPRDAGAGRALALRLCVACHIVEPGQSLQPIFKGPPAPPDFPTIAKRASTDAQSLRRFLATTHAAIAPPLSMANPELTDDQTTRIITFILSLRDHK